jgi:hypothetical protein
LLSGLLLLLVLQSCTLEKKFGKEFVAQAPKICIDLNVPDYLFKFNHKGELIPGFDSLTSAQQDSALYAYSHFIRYIDDSMFLDNYVNSFIDELRGIGFRVFMDGTVDSILRNEAQAYVVSMSQVQLDEYFQPFEDSQQFGDSVYYKSFDLNAVDASSWFELNKYGVPNPVKTLLYANFTATDGFSGNFSMNNFTMDLKYKYKIDSLKIKDIYDLASFTGRRDANYLFDYFMNQYISYRMPDGMEMLGYLHYTPATRSFNFTDEEKFEVLNSK